MSTTTSPPDVAATTGADGSDGPAAKGGRRKLVIVLLLVLALAGGGYWFVLKPGGGEPAEPVPGEVLVLEPVQVNLAAGHYLRIGLALQMAAGGGEEGEMDGSKALDATIELFTGRKVAELTSAETRNELRSELLETLEKDYHGEVMDIYFTEFVTQ
jgi:flagellar protein FliL